MLTLTVDVEQYAGNGSEGRFLLALQPLLTSLASLEAQVTFFVVGDLVNKSTQPIRDLHGMGHEIALHGYTHRFLKELGPSEFRAELIRGKEQIEAITQSPMIGFRAPYFSLTKDALWAPEILSSEGFVYSSSILPSFNPQSGYHEAPRVPFLWPSGLIEFPSPTLGLGKFRLPILGGAYLRLSPKLLVNVAKRNSSKHVGAWSYCHPYDFDVDEEFHVRKENGWLFSKLLFARRRLMLNRINNIVTPGSLSLGQIANAVSDQHHLSIWDPLEES